MRIFRHQPPPPPPEYTLAFTKEEGWVIVAALRDYANDHKDAVGALKWVGWAKDLDFLLRGRADIDDWREDSAR